MAILTQSSGQSPTERGEGWAAIASGGHSVEDFAVTGLARRCYQSKLVGAGKGACPGAWGQAHAVWVLTLYQ